MLAYVYVFNRHKYNEYFRNFFWKHSSSCYTININTRNVLSGSLVSKLLSVWYKRGAVVECRILITEVIIILIIILKKEYRRRRNGSIPRASTETEINGGRCIEMDGD